MVVTRSTQVMSGSHAIWSQPPLRDWLRDREGWANVSQWDVKRGSLGAYGKVASSLSPESHTKLVCSTARKYSAS